MRITLYEFLALPDQEQYEVLFSEGNYLDIVFEKETRYVLYAVDRFFVEVEYNNAENKIVNQTAFKTDKLLDKYSTIPNGF